MSDPPATRAHSRSGRRARKAALVGMVAALAVGGVTVHVSLANRSGARGPTTTGQVQSLRGFSFQPHVLVASPLKVDHVMVIMMENTSYDELIGSSRAPFLNQLAHSGAQATNFMTQPGQAYLDVVAGQNLAGTSMTCATCVTAVPNLTDLIDAAGGTWKGYMEDLPRAGYVGQSVGLYSRAHDPFAMFSRVFNNPTQRSRIVPLAGLYADLHSAATTPTLSVVSPNLCHDGHNVCSPNRVGQEDAWLAQTVPTILASPAWTTQNSLLVVTWDEGSRAAEHRVPFIALGAGVRRGATSTAPYTLYSLTRTIEAVLGLGPLGAHDDAAKPMADLFVVPLVVRPGDALRRHVVEERPGVRSA